MSLISVNNLTFGYEGSINNVFENVSFNIDTDWKLGLIGRNGKGKTTFLKLLLGKYKFHIIKSKNKEERARRQGVDQWEVRMKSGDEYD